MQYAEKEAVVLWVNKVGPYNNPTETYNYFSLPYCRRYPDKKPEHAWGGLGEVLEGNELINSHYDIKFRGRHGPWLACMLLQHAAHAQSACCSMIVVACMLHGHPASCAHCWHGFPGVSSVVQLNQWWCHGVD